MERTATTDVIFRKWNSNGDVIALFPAVPASMDGRNHQCLSYEHVGQHGSASLDLSPHTTLAKPREYADLKRELEGMGYRLRVVKRVTALHHRARNSIRAEGK